LQVVEGDDHKDFGIRMIVVIPGIAVVSEIVGMLSPHLSCPSTDISEETGCKELPTGKKMLKEYHQRNSHVFLQ
jgi:hypothetical protein